MDTDSGPYARSPYLYNPEFSYWAVRDFDVNQNLQAVWRLAAGDLPRQRTSGWRRPPADGRSAASRPFTRALGGLRPIRPRTSSTASTCNYGYLALRPNYLGGAGKNTSNGAFETGSNFVPPGTSANPENTGTNNNLFTDNYFSVPDFTAAITRQAFTGQSTNTFIPPPGIGRNSFPGPGYRDVDLTVGKAFGLPKMPVLGEDAKFEIKANMFNIFNLLNINPSSLSTNVQSSNLGQASSALGARMVDFQARFSF